MAEPVRRVFGTICTLLLVDVTRKMI